MAEKEIKKIKVGENTYNIVDANAARIEVVNSIPTALGDDDLKKLYRVNASNSVTTLYEVDKQTTAGGTTCNVICTENGRQLATSTFFGSAFIDSNYKDLFGSNVSAVTVANIYTGYYEMQDEMLQAYRLGTAKNPGNISLSNVSASTIKVILGQYYSYNGQTGIKTYESGEVTLNGTTYTLNEEPTEYEVTISGGTLNISTTQGAGRAFLYGFKTSGSATVIYEAKELAKKDFVTAGLNAERSYVTGTVEPRITAAEGNIGELRNTKVSKSGSTMTGDLVFSDNALLSFEESAWIGRDQEYNFNISSDYPISMSSNSSISLYTVSDQISLSTSSGSISINGYYGLSLSSTGEDLNITAGGDDYGSTKVNITSGSDTNTTIDGTIIPRNKTLETTNNKVTLGSSNTTTQYPNAKSVWDECVNIRAVAEGKSKTCVLEGNEEAPDIESFSYSQYYRLDGTRIETFSDFEEYVDGGNCVNSDFLSSEDYLYPSESGYILATGFYVGERTAITVIRIGDIQPEGVFKIGDIFLVTETNYPDRYLGLYAGGFYKLETSKVDLGWSQIGTTSDPKPTTLSGYGITSSDSLLSGKVNKSGDTMTGDLNIASGHALTFSTDGPAGSLYMNDNYNMTIGGNGLGNLYIGTGADASVSIGDNGRPAVLLDSGIGNKMELADSSGILFDSSHFEAGGTIRGYYKLPYGDGSTSSNRYTLATEEYVASHSGTTSLENGAGELSVSQKTSSTNEAKSLGSIVFGEHSRAGIFGWYYSYINFSTNSIYLSATQGIVSIEPSVDTSFISNLEVGDLITVNNANDFNDIEVTAINGNKITVESLPFDTIATPHTEDANNYMVYCVEKRDLGSVDLGHYSKAYGMDCFAGIKNAFAEGYQTQAIGAESHAEGFNTIALLEQAHAEGSGTKALGRHSHAEGFRSEAQAVYSHAEGLETIAAGSHSHAEGGKCSTHESAAHAEGYDCHAYAKASHAGGWGTEVGSQSGFAQGRYLVIGRNQSSTPTEGAAAFGRYNIDTNALFTIGNGTSVNNRSNALTVSTDGQLNVSGNIITNGSFKFNSSVENSISVVNASIAITSGGSPMLWLPNTSEHALRPYDATASNKISLGSDSRRFKDLYVNEKIKIGNATLNETQLQKLIALLDTMEAE